MLAFLQFWCVVSALQLYGVHQVAPLRIEMGTSNWAGFRRDQEGDGAGQHSWVWRRMQLS